MPVRNFSNKEYNGGTQNWSITQRSDDFMLFGNNQGLMCFDGNRWEMMRVANYSVVRAVYFDKQTGRMYVGASNELGYFEGNSNNYKTEYHSIAGMLPAGKRKFGEIWNVFRHGKNIVFQSKDDIFIYNGKENIRIYNNKHRIETATNINGRIIIACKDGIYTINNNAMQPVKGTGPMKGMNIRAIMGMGKYTLFATDGDGVFIYDGKNTTPYNMDITPYLKENRIFCADISDKYIAFGTIRGGLVIKDIKTGRTAYANRNTGLQNNTVLSVKFDKMNNIWLGLDNGISYVQNDTPYNNIPDINNSIGTGYASITYGNNLYLGTNQGLFVTSYPLAMSPSQPQPVLIPGMAGQVWKLADIDGTLLCGTDNGAYIIDGTSAIKIDGPEGTWNFKKLNRHPGLVIACDYKGFFIMQKQGKGYVMRNRLKGFNEISGGFYEDKDGTIWVSHWQKGIFHLWLSNDLTTVKKQEYFHKGNGLVLDENNLLCNIDGNIYISSVDGIYRYKDGKMVYDKAKSMIFNTYGSPLRIKETPGNQLWAYKEKFIALATKRADGKYNVDSTSFREAVRHLQISTSNLGYADSIHTLFNSDEGFCLINHTYKSKDNNSKAIIRAITSTNNGDTVLYRCFPAGDKSYIEIPNSMNSLKIEFVEPEYRDDKAVSYSCLLEGYDKKWTMQQYATSKEYTRLPKGRYIFRVRATNHITGKTTETEMTIKILPAWYETWIAYCIYIIMITVTIYGAVEYIKKHAERELVRIKEEKEKQQREMQTRFEIENAKKEKELMMLRNSQLEIELKHKSSKLADSAMNLIRKNDMLQELDDSMNDLSEKVRSEESKAKIAKKINDIRHSIKQNMNDDDNWDKFEQNFNLVYDNFMVKLTKEYPELKSSDKKLCIYLRMGLSSKEMASLLNTSVRSIETARYRLRKKLNLDSGDNLTDFIQSFENQL